MADDKDPAFIIVCMRADAPLTVEGATMTRRCYKCGRKVMTAPSSEHLLKEQPGIKCICNGCVVPEDITAVAITEDAIDEMQHHIPNSRYNNRN